jgi:hypothetical protein
MRPAVLGPLSNECCGEATKPRVRNFARVTAMSWLIIGTVALLGMLASAPVLQGRMPSNNGPFAKDVFKRGGGRTAFAAGRCG